MIEETVRFWTFEEKWTSNSSEMDFFETWRANSSGGFGCSQTSFQKNSCLLSALLISPLVLSLLFCLLFSLSFCLLSLSSFPSVSVWCCVILLLCDSVSVCCVVCEVWCNTLKTSVCTFETSPCMPATRAHAFQHVRVVEGCTETFWMWHTEGRAVSSISSAFQNLPTYAPKKPMDPICSSNAWSRATRCRFLQSFAVPDIYFQFQQSWGTLRREPVVTWFGLTPPSSPSSTTNNHNTHNNHNNPQRQQQQHARAKTNTRTRTRTCACASTWMNICTCTCVWKCMCLRATNVDTTSLAYSNVQNIRKSAIGEMNFPFTFGNTTSFALSLSE